MTAFGRVMRPAARGAAILMALALFRKHRVTGGFPGH